MMVLLAAASARATLYTEILNNANTPLAIIFTKTSSGSMN